MRRFVIASLVVLAACSGGDADTTTTPPSTTTTVPPPPTTTTSPSTSTTTSTSTTSTTVADTIPAGFTTFTHSLFSLSYPDNWSENPEFPGFGGGWIEDHSALALPATLFSVSLEEQEVGFDLDAHIQRIQDDLAFFVPDFRVLQSGEELVDGARSLWFEYSEEFDGFPIAIREQVALRDNLLVTFTLISPVEFFEFDVGQAITTIESFRFS